MNNSILKPADVRRVVWPVAIPLAAALSLAWWLSSAGARREPPEWLAYGAGVEAAAAILLYLALARGAAAPSWRRVAATVLAMAGCAVYARALAPPGSGDVTILAWIHLPAMAWLLLGLTVLGVRSGPEARFAGLIKTFEVIVTSAVFAVAGVVFAALSIALFGALDLTLPESLVRWFHFGVPGLIPVLAVASAWDPDRRVEEQVLGQGLPRLFFLVARIFLLPTLIVLAIYLAVLPARFEQPFRHRETLIVFNGLLFAVMALLVCAAPRPGEALTPRGARLLRLGIVAVAALALAVSLHAFAAILDRTVRGGLTVNRITVIGWNAVNIATLVWLLALQARAGAGGWVPALHRAYARGLAGYALWTAFVLVVLPFLHRFAGFPRAIAGAP